MCTLYKGVPHGIALINYTDPMLKGYSFRGVGVFHHGHLHNAPFTYLNGDGFSGSFSKMYEGRPADASYTTYFYRNDETQHVDSLKAKIDVGG